MSGSKPKPPDKSKGEGKSDDSLKPILKPIIKLEPPSGEEPDWADDIKPSNNGPGLQVPNRKQSVASVSNLGKLAGGDVIARSRGISIGSIHSTASTLISQLHKRQNRTRQVRFLDNVAWRSISAIRVHESTLSIPDYYDDEQSSFDLDDPNELPGFANLFYSKEVTISESCCGGNVHTILEGQDGNVLYHAVKKVDGSCASVVKWCCPFKLNYTRVGFSISLYSGSIGSKLVTFTRSMYWLANQLDIVETFYTLQKCYLGRIEKSSEGYCIIDRRGVEIYEVIRDEKVKKTLNKTETTLIVKSKNGMLSDAIIQYSKKTCFSSVFPLCCLQFKHSISWMYDGIDVISKVLLLGVLFMELNSNEEYVDLPLGSDAVRVTPNF